MVSDQAGERLFSFFSESELKQLIEKAGFKLERTEIIDDNVLTGKKIQPPPPRWICLYATKQ